MLIAAYGNDYYVATPYKFTTTSAQSYTLPDGSSSYRDINGNIAPKFYKLLGADLQYASSPTGFITLRRFEMIERNRYQNPNVTINYSPITNIRYRLSGDNIYLTPAPQSGQTIQLWYAPAPTSLQFILPTSIALNGTIGSLSNTTGLSIGMNVVGNGIKDNTTVSAIGSVSVTFSNSFTLNNPSAILSYYDDSTLMEGIAGWEEFIIIDSAIKVHVKQENDIQPLLVQKQEVVDRIQGMAEGRDIGQAQHVSDAVGANGYDAFGGFGGSGYFDSGSGAW